MAYMNTGVNFLRITGMRDLMVLFIKPTNCKGPEVRSAVCNPNYEGLYVTGATYNPNCKGLYITLQVLLLKPTGL